MLDERDAREVIASVASGFTEFDVPEHGRHGPDGPLDWPGYGEARARAADRTGERESVVCGTATIGAHRVVLLAFDFRYLGGSVGTAAGDRIEHAYAHARRARTPLVSLIATGGTRMQEGVPALMQLRRTARNAVLLRQAGVPHIAVLRDPTTGGVWASLGASADVVIGIEGAQVAFGGSRVRPQPDHPAFTAEGQLTAGNIDEVTTPTALPDTLDDWLTLLTSATADPAEPPRALGSDTPVSPWETVERARATHRAQQYLDDYFDLRRPISGDRAGGVDPGMLCGIGLRGRHSIAYAAQTGTATTPAGYRTATRLVELADRLTIPVLTLVDTPGADNTAEAEAAGLAPAIADLFTTIASARVPVTTLVIGEGGSGGALALTAPDRTWMTPDSYFAVIAPELATAILKRPARDAPTVADHLRLRPQDLLAAGLIRGVVGP